MTTNRPLVPTKELIGDQVKWIDLGLLSKISEGSEQFIIEDQLNRLKRLSETADSLNYTNPHPTSLFPNSDEIFLGRGTILIDCRPASSKPEANDILYQLLPLWIEEADNKNINIPETNWEQILLGEIEVLSKNPYLIERIRTAQSSVAHLLDSRTTQFARSASYMGSKASLAPYFVEILKDLLPNETVMVDLMCGSGAASGILSSFWKTIATDAQKFSRMLAVVQGGGMDASRARSISDKVLSRARVLFSELPKFLRNSIEIEKRFLSSELSSEVLDEFSDWIINYPRINNPKCEPNNTFTELVTEGRNSESRLLPILFSSYYSNLFFGVRQAAEIDCLRVAIEDLTDEEEKNWALGALVCSVSSRAYSYGGHFAQPKLDCSSRDKVKKLAPEMLVSWGQSVSHEFFVRLTNLGNESSNVKFPIMEIAGPWEEALSTVRSMIHSDPVCIYLDPPYTRDEYSRYYHVLETLVRYDFPEVQDKPSIPKRGQAGRFASSFATRNTVHIEDIIVSIIKSCTQEGWSCLWSYSSSGAASIKNIIERLPSNELEMHVFSMDYAYKAQGKQGKKKVKEHAILLKNRKF